MNQNVKKSVYVRKENPRRKYAQILSMRYYVSLFIVWPTLTVSFTVGMLVDAALGMKILACGIALWIVCWVILNALLVSNLRPLSIRKIGFIIRGF
jgi:hypothetical protein